MAVTSYAKKHTIEFQWQPRYHDHVIRDEGSLKRIRKYIKDNQKNWPM
jgi:REP element-mobilizing transposase RayT